MILFLHSNNFNFIKLFWLKQYVQLKDFYFELTLDPIGLIMANPLKTLLYAFLFLFSFTIFFGFASTIMFYYKEVKRLVVVVVLLPLLRQLI